MNRHERRKAKARSQGRKIKFNEMYSNFDVWFESKPAPQVIMIVASPVGQRAVEDLWPDVQWSRDETFSESRMPLDWKFAHVRVTKLQPFLEEVVPLAFADGDALAFAAALALRHHASHLSARIGWWSGPLDDIHSNKLTYSETPRPRGGAGTPHSLLSTCPTAPCLTYPRA
jgi:hypothetical protein